MMILLPFSLFACGSDKDDFAPKEGDWEVVLVSLDDGCGLYGDAEPSSDTAETHTLTMDSDGAGFTVETGVGVDTGGAESPIISCDLDGKDFTCQGDDASNQPWDLSEDGVDAIVYLTQSVGGSFSSETTGTLNSELAATCEGTECDTASDMMKVVLPCSSTSTASLTAD